MIVEESSSNRSGRIVSSFNLLCQFIFGMGFMFLEGFPRAL